MTAFVVTESTLGNLKKHLSYFLPDVKSSHLTESIAAGFGYLTNAAFKSKLSEIIGTNMVFKGADFSKRLKAFGYKSDTTGNVSTILKDFRKKLTSSYKSTRAKAWRNLLVCAINAGLKQKVFSTVPEGNFWDGYQTNEPKRSTGQWSFTLPNGLSAKAFVQDIGWGELSIGVVVNPARVGPVVLGAGALHILGFKLGDVVACCWFERKDGAWIQESEVNQDTFRCRQHLLKEMASLDVFPIGYADKGRFYL